MRMHGKARSELLGALDGEWRLGSGLAVMGRNRGTGGISRRHEAMERGSWFLVWTSLENRQTDIELGSL